MLIFKDIFYVEKSKSIKDLLSMFYVSSIKPVAIRHTAARALMQILFNSSERGVGERDQEIQQIQLLLRGQIQSTLIKILADHGVH